MFFRSLILRVARGPLWDQFWEGFGVPLALVLGFKSMQVKGLTIYDSRIANAVFGGLPVWWGGIICGYSFSW